MLIVCQNVTLQSTQAATGGTVKDVVPLVLEPRTF